MNYSIQYVMSMYVTVFVTFISNIVFCLSFTVSYESLFLYTFIFPFIFIFCFSFLFFLITFDPVSIYFYFLIAFFFNLSTPSVFSFLCFFFPLFCSNKYTCDFTLSITTDTSDVPRYVTFSLLPGAAGNELVELYGEFYARHRQGKTLLEELTRASPRFKAYLTKCETHPSIQRRKLADCYLIINQRFSKVESLLVTITETTISESSAVLEKSLHIAMQFSHCNFCLLFIVYFNCFLILKLLKECVSAFCAEDFYSIRL